MATNVLSFSNKNEKCEGCCDPQHEFHPAGRSYGQPEIHLVNGTSKLMFLKQSKSVRNLTGTMTIFQVLTTLFMSTCFSKTYTNEISNCQITKLVQ